MSVVADPTTPKEGVCVVEVGDLKAGDLGRRIPLEDRCVVVRGPTDAVLSAVAALPPQAAVPLPDTIPREVSERIIASLEAWCGALQDVRARHGQMELELRHGQKMDAVGQLASGIAHEINTPIQFVGDSLFFIQGAVDDLMSLVDLALSDPDPAALSRLAEEMDLAYLRDEMPRAFRRTKGGCDRVSTIVRAMRHFAKQDAAEACAADLVAALKSTLVVATSELKFVADVHTDFAPLPLVICRIGDLNQVFLNLLVNAAHAVADADRGRGRIDVSTSLDDDQVIVRVSDDGVGIPAEVQERVFEPFFTTKEVGRGTGQGLAICHAIVERHGGELSFETTLGVGTTFIVRIPVRPRTT